MIHLVDIDAENWRIPLSVSQKQESYVADTNTILARAYAYRKARSEAFYIYDDETPVGMGLYHDEETLNAYIFSELLIDEQFQGKGYGKAATMLILDRMKNDGKYEKVVLCYIKGNDAAKTLYQKFGFIEIDRDGDEVIMEAEL